ncbi:hypothetical protein [Nitrosomonas sp.]
MKIEQIKIQFSQFSHTPALTLKKTGFSQVTVLYFGDYDPFLIWIY